MTEHTVENDTICKSPGCGGLGVYHVGVEVRGPGWMKPLPIATTLVVCEVHKANPPDILGDVLSDEHRLNIGRMVKQCGRPPLNFKSARLTFKPVTP